MPPPTIEFDEDDLKSQNSFRNSRVVSPTNENMTNLDPDTTDGGDLRERAHTYAYQLRSRVGSSVTHISRVLVNEKQDPTKHRRHSTKRNLSPSSRFPKRASNDDPPSRYSSCSNSSDVSLEKAKFGKGSLREEEEEEEEGEEEGEVEGEVEGGVEEYISQKLKIPRSANTSPICRPLNKHLRKRVRSSEQIVEVNTDEVRLEDLAVPERTKSADLPLDPIDWEAVEDDKVNIFSCKKCVQM